MKNIHIIGTDKPSRLYLTKEGFYFLLPNIKGNDVKFQHIYITSDEEIKEDDWYLNTLKNTIDKCEDIISQKNVNLSSWLKKIILTTDQDLIGVQAIDDEFLEWFVNNPSCEEVEVNEKLIIIQDKPLVQHQGNKPIVVPHRINYKIIILSEPKKKHIVMKNIHVIPTDKISRLYSGDNGNFVFGMLQTSIQSRNDDFKNQNISITNDEEIKEADGSWIIDLRTNKIAKNINNHIKVWNENCKKIILTTDVDLIKDGVQPIPNEFLEWFVKNPSCEEVEVKSQHIDEFGNYIDDCFHSKTDSYVYKIIIPKEKPKPLKKIIMKNIHIIGTDKPSRLLKRTSNIFIDENGSEENAPNNFKEGTLLWLPDLMLNNKTWQNQNIYITSDVEIKEGDWVIYTQGAIIHCVKIQNKGDIELANIENSGVFKITLTTDLDLIKDGVQDIDDEFLEWFVKNPSCEEVEVRKIEDELISSKNPKIRFNALQDPPSFISTKSLNDMILTYKYKIIIPKEEPKPLKKSL